MRRLFAAALCGVAVLGFILHEPAPAAEGESKSALESDPKGWVELLSGKDLKDWKRVPIPPDVKLADKNPWSLDADTKVLHCDGVGIKEMYLHQTEHGDGIFHIEWRFKKVEGKTGYNSGVYVRGSPDGKVWHQAQVAFIDKPPLVADLFGETLVSGQPKHFQVLGTGHKHAKGPGEWNTYEITCKGKTVSVWLNGHVVTTWNECEVPKGLVGMQAEFFYIEFRNLKFKDMR
jgi:hypothetical protein